MPQIPFYEQRTSAPGAPQLARMPVPDNSGVAYLADSVNHVADNVQRVEQRDAAIEGSSALSKLRMAWTQKLTDAKANAADDAENFTPNLMKSLGDDLNTTLADIKSPLAKVMVKEHAQELKSQYFDHAIGFEAATRQAYRTNQLDQSAARLSQSIQQDPDSWKQAGEEQMLAIEAMQLPPEQRLRERDKMFTTVKTAAAMGYANRDPVELLKRAKSPDDPLMQGLSIQARQHVQEYAKKELVEKSAQGVMSVFENGGTDAGVHALASLSSSGLEPELLDDVRAKVNRDVSQLRDQRRQEHVGDLTQLQVGIATDTVSPQSLRSVDSLYQAGALTPGEHASYSAQVESSIIQRNKNAAAAKALADSLAAGIPLSPSDPEHKKFLSQAFANETATMPLGSQQWQSTAIALADRARMLPQQAAEWTQRAMRSPDPQLAANAAQFFGAVKTSSPDAASSFDERTKAFAGVVNGMIEAGTKSEMAVETARTNVFDLKPELVEHRKKQYTEGGSNSLAAQSDSALSSLIGKDFGSWFSSNPAATANLSADFNQQSQRYFVKTGDIDLARKLAWDDLKGVYGETTVNGTKQIMAFPVERFGIKPEEVHADVESFLKDNPQHDGSTAAEVVLIPDALTLRHVGDAFSGQMQPTSYKLVTKSGALVVDKNGIPKRYTLPSGDELTQRMNAEQDKATAAAQKMVDDAKASQAMWRSHDQFVREHPELQVPAVGGY